MVFIKNQKENSNCQYQAHVWMENHSHQCGCFAIKAAAERWANWLQREIVTKDLFKVTHKGLDG